MEVQLGDIVAALGGDLIGSAALPLLGLASLQSAEAHHLGFVTGAKHRAAMRASRAGALIVPPDLAEEAATQAALIVTPNPYLYYARLSQWWLAKVRAGRGSGGIHATACVHPTAQLAANVSIGPFAVIEADAVLEAGAQLGPHTVVGRAAHIGAQARIAGQVWIGEGCELGARCIVHAGTVIGADGFGFAPEQGAWAKIEQLGRVRIGDDVEIGANCTIDRGALDDTVIEDGVKLDNLIHIAHNVHIGAHTAMAGCAAVAGSTRIGKHCTIGGDAKIIGHLTLVDSVHISACSVVTRSITKPGTYTGIFPLDDNAAWEKNAASLRQLYKLRERVRALEKNNPKSDV
ncbi:UDP-3-O-(3-hydroxymyristoyl)glucosamine N-acyltransferase [Inhella gelatinilytica]|uniref:UDP-3-O-acylglucosamine N-acyltransferase n=1 Tax=Inhella gelatinilytica TaxID=2795030 RepID=A0A931IYG4_9BURK|nr:UDP-3-O-(3-hydroxymyristoyl)glucosamine N-acyltransferase [Inhella gelatinilytica]MBH9553394.1 UDP-3-O-(3-hydroxymyristoyl)glucosamine N-acyltransferase [Inhella gelatinilytica]